MSRNFGVAPSYSIDNRIFPREKNRMKLVNLASLLLGVIVLCSEISFIQNQCFTELNVKYGGVELTSTTSSSNTIGSCCTDCCANPSCNSWSYDLLTRKCTLKSSLPVRSICSGFMGKIKPGVNRAQRSVDQRILNIQALPVTSLLAVLLALEESRPRPLL